MTPVDAHRNLQGVGYALAGVCAILVVGVIVLGIYAMTKVLTVERLRRVLSSDPPRR